MKNILKSIMLVAAAAIAFVSCSVEPTETPFKTSGTHRVSFIASQVDTKTTMEISNGIANFAWEKTDEEYFHIFENGVPAVETIGVIDEKNGTMEIASEFGESSAPYTYTGFMAATISNENPAVSNEQFDLGAYDPESDILVAKPVSDKQPEDISKGILFQFKRVVAINMMTLKGIPAGETVSTVSITSDKPIAGEYDFVNGEWNASETSIFITTESVANNDGQAVVYFVSAPVESAQLTITATTAAGKTYSKELAKTITFNEGSVKAFGVTVEKDAPKPVEVVFDNLGFESWGKTESFSGNTYDSVTQTVGNVKFDYIRNNGSCYANKTAIRFYKDNELTFTAPSGYYITDIEWTGSDLKGDVTTDVELCTSTTSELSWKGTAYSVTFTRPSNANSYINLSKVSVTIVAGEIPVVDVVSVELDRTEITLEVGGTETIVATVLPENATNKKVSWSSSKEDVATVKDGVVTAIAPGKATITVKTVDGGFTATCNVTVNAAPIKVYGSLAELIADGEPTREGRCVTVTLTNEVIESIYITQSGYRNGVFLKVPNQKVEIFCYDVPENWETLGMLSGTLTECTWKNYNGTWELCPESWGELKYSAPVKYDVHIASGIVNGTVSVDPTQAAEGQTVTITATPASGYKVKSVSAKTASGDAIDVTDNQFIMPAESVTVSAVFELNDSPKEDKTATIRFGTNDVKISAQSVIGKDDLENNWTITTEGTTSFTPQPTYCQVGSAKAPASSITFTTTLPSDAEVTSIASKFGGFSGTAGIVALKVGADTIGTGSLNETNDVIVTSDKTASGNTVTITVTNIAKGVRVYNIVVNYKSAN